MNRKAKDERELETVRALLEFLELAGEGTFVLDPQKPDQIDRRRKAPDFTIKSKSADKKKAVEITSLYKSANAGHEDSVWLETIGDLHIELRRNVKGSAWVYFPELGRNTPNLENRRRQQEIRTRLLQMLPALIDSLPVSKQPQVFRPADIPFEFLIRKTKVDGAWIGTSRLVPTSQNIDMVVEYLRKVLPIKDQKFEHPDYSTHEHVVLLENQIPFAEDDLAQRALDVLSRDCALARIDRLFLVGFGRADELRNPWRINLPS